MRTDRARFSPSHGSDVVDAFHGTCKRTHYLHELGDVMHACLFDDDSLACLRRTGVHATSSSHAAFSVHGDAHGEVGLAPYSRFLAWSLSPSSGTVLSMWLKRCIVLHGYTLECRLGDVSRGSLSV